jgi:hypothetical protein
MEVPIKGTVSHDEYFFKGLKLKIVGRWYTAVVFSVYNDGFQVR